jgi:DNA-directed RNA polymerase specialized sigma24 family protein
MSEPEAGLSAAQHDEWGRRTEQETVANDVRMMEWVRAAGPDSDEVALLRTNLKSVARGELMKLHVANKLIARVESMLLITLPPPPDDWRHSAEGLVYLSVEQSLDRFFATAVFGDEQRRWRPDGASVRTFFVNKCLLTLKDLYREDHRKRGAYEIPYNDLPGEDDGTARLALYPAPPKDPESQAVLTDLIRRMRNNMTEEDAQIVWEKSAGKTHKEIGRDLSISDDAVGSKLYRLRRRIDR